MPHWGRITSFPEEENTLAQKRVFISFDWHNDRNYRYLLSALNANSGNDIDFVDSTPGEIDTKDVGRVKAVLTTKIREATHTLILIGEHANAAHEDQKKIGTRNWQWWEIEQSIAEKNKLIGVKIESSNESPTPLLSTGAKWASYTVDSILQAL
jgi:MTH538 TIR-like domain (DUF1863).